MSDSTYFYFPCCCDLYIAQNFLLTPVRRHGVIKEILLTAKNYKTDFLPKTYLIQGGKKLRTEMTMLCLRVTGMT